MTALVVYESMYGNTRQVAQAIADGLGTEAVPVSAASAARLTGVHLVVIGGPTHVHGLSRTSSRKAAAEAAAKPGSGLILEPGVSGIGVREWLYAYATDLHVAAVFDTRIATPAILSGRASRHIAKLLERDGVALVSRPQSFLVSKENRLLPGELDRARRWGADLAAHVALR